MSWLNAHESFLMDFAVRDRLDDLQSTNATASAGTADIRDTCSDCDGHLCGFALIPATKGGEAR